LTRELAQDLTAIKSGAGDRGDLPGRDPAAWMVVRRRQGPLQPAPVAFLSSSNWERRPSGKS